MPPLLLALAWAEAVAFVGPVGEMDEEVFGCVVPPLLVVEAFLPVVGAGPPMAVAKAVSVAAAASAGEVVALADAVVCWLPEIVVAAA